MTRFSIRFCLALAAVCAAIGAPVSSHAAEPAGDRPIRALLVIGGAFHDFAHQKDILVNGISARANVRWKIAYDPAGDRTHPNPVYDNPNWADGFDVVVHDECSGGVTDLGVVRRALKPHRDGLPAVVLHTGMHAFRTEGWPKAVTPWFEFTGLQTTGHGAQFPISIHFIDPKSPIVGGLEDWTTIHEELYNNAVGKLLDTAHALARGTQIVKQSPPKKKAAANPDEKTPEADQPAGGKEKVADNIVAWTNIYNEKTRVFATTIGHNNETVSDPRYLDLVTRGLLWAVDKLDDAHLKPAKQPYLDKEPTP
ncbi:MAG TPA: ThuA domain-containing protein [Pirellulales bacterium]|jgi:hypothetical protein|nr:ThuA domain-containing protein [Pirellulales bacterium]